MAKGFQLYYGAGVRAKSSELLDECNKRYASGEGDKFLVIVPTHRYALDITRRMTESAPQQWRRPPVYSIESFIHLLIPKDGATGTVISSREMAIIISEIVLGDSKRFEPLLARQPEEPFPGLIAAAADAIIEVKKEFDKDPGIKGENDGASAIFRKIFEQYQKHLKKQGFADSGDVYRLAAGASALKALREQFPNLDTIIFDGIDVFPQTLINMMRNISGEINNTIVLVEYEENRPLLFGHMEETFRRLSKSSASIHKIAASGKSFKDEVLENLYQSSEETHLSSANDEFIKSYRLPNRTKEVRFIARYIKEKVLNKEAELRDFCVCFPSISKYSSLVSEIFEEYGIPYNLSPGAKLARIPSIRAVELWLSLVESDFERAYFLRILINPYLNVALIAPEKNRPRVDSLFNCIRELRGGEGIASWIESLQQNIDANKMKLQRLADGNDYSDEEKERRSPEELERDVQEHLKILSVFEKLKELAAKFAGEKTFNDFNKLLTKSLALMEFQKGIHFPKEEIPVSLYRRDVKALNQLNKILEEQNHLHQNIGDKPITFARFAEELRAALAETSFHADEPITEGVQILGRLEPRLFSFPYFILGGFLQGEMPHMAKISPFLDSEERRRIGMPSVADSMSSDRYLFYHYLRQTQKRMIITRPAFDNENPLLPSPILHELERVAALETVMQGKSATIYSEQEWQRARGDPAKTEADKNIQIIPDEKLKKWCLFSTTQLEKYAECPFKFFAEIVLRLSEPPSDKPDEELTNLERGIILHRVLFLFYREWTDKKKVPFTDEKSADEAARRLIEIAEVELKALPYNDLFWDAEKEELLSSLKDFAQKEMGFFEKQGQYIPKFFEVVFGDVNLTQGSIDPISTKIPYTIKEESGDIALRGKIDRIEVCGDSFAVVDYKSGKKTKQLCDVREGTSLQLAIYLLAAKAILEKHLKRKMEMAAGIFYKVNAKEIKRDSQILLYEDRASLGCGGKHKDSYCGTQEELEALLEGTKNFIKKYVNGIREGSFPVKPHEKASRCDKCSFNAACRL